MEIIRTFDYRHCKAGKLLNAKFERQDSSFVLKYFGNSNETLKFTKYSTIKYQNFIPKFIPIIEDHAQDIFQLRSEFEPKSGKLAKQA